MSNFVENLKLENEQAQAFNFGYVNLPVKDCYVLMGITQDEFNTKYKHYYTMGISFCKFETLKKILNKSDLSLEALKEYGSYRKIYDIDEMQTIIPMTTTDLINKLKNGDKNENK